ncbi:MAG: Rpn family recombination-promoting nuclease/putative transposase, partial [Bacteroidota bacterium]
LSRIELAEGKHMSDQGVTLYNDLLYKCPLESGQDAYLFIMCEHQRTPYKHMCTRLMKYDVGVHEDCQRQEHRYMPIILHFVLYNGSLPWPYSTAFADYYADPVLGSKYLYMAPFILIDIPTYLPADIENDPELGFYFGAFKASTASDPYEAFAKHCQINNFEQHVRGLPLDLKQVLARYLGHFVDEKRHKLSDVIDLVSREEAEKKTIMTSIAQVYQQQGIQQGMQQGMQSKALDVARNMLHQLHLGIEAIQQVTGLSKKEIEALR